MFKPPNTKARDLFGGKGLFTVNPNYWRTWYGSEFAGWMDLSKTKLTELVADKAEHLKFFFNDDDVEGEETFKTYISAYKDKDYSLGGYFRDSLMYYLEGDYMLYKPNLVANDLWKYDLSGETEYGLITPPVDTEYEFFDRNFSAQFTVYGKTRTCKDLGLSCANPKALLDGPIPLTESSSNNSGCTAGHPYCNCPAQYLAPEEKEPTYLELAKLENEINECALIKEYLGDDWLGCELSNPDSTCSCNCPEQGRYFWKYLAYTRTHSTFWNCPPKLPLVRTAQLAQLQAQKIRIKVNTNEKVKVGSLIELFVQNDNPLFTKNKYKKVSGKWLVAEIIHMISSTNHEMELILVRNSLHYDPKDVKKPFGITNKGNSNED
jgi:hypothetical protein